MNHIMNVLDKHMQRPTPLVQKAAIYLYIGKNIFKHVGQRQHDTETSPPDGRFSFYKQIAGSHSSL